MAKNAAILIQNDLHAGATFRSGEGDPARKSLWIKRVALLAVSNRFFLV